MPGDKIFHNSVFERIPETKRKRILTMAIEEFAEKGFSTANINVIAEKCEISVGSMYKYFNSKEDLYLTVVNLCFNTLEETLRPILDSNGSVFEKINQIIDKIFSNRVEHQQLNKLYTRFTTEGDMKLAEKLAVKIETITANAYSSLLRQAKEEGIISKDADERVFAFCIDNIFLILQFSLSSNYFQNRFKIYLGNESNDNYEYIKDQINLFIKRALTI